MHGNNKGQYIKDTNGNTFEGFGVWNNTKGYPCISIGGHTIPLHIYIWERANGNRPKGMNIHHKDFNPANYKLCNLELVTISDHRKLHSGWVRENGEWVAKTCNTCGRVLPLSEYYIRRGHTPASLCKSCHKEALHKWHRTPEFRQKNKERQRQRYPQKREYYRAYYLTHRKEKKRDGETN
jgi:hypothetical protein